MTDAPQPEPDACPLTSSQATRVDFARRDLECARSADLADLDPDNLVLMIDRLRGRLGDILDLIGEVSAASRSNPTAE
jgi:hypothetical protein